jgi:hypothetical protein
VLERWHQLFKGTLLTQKYSKNENGQSPDKQTEKTSAQEIFGKGILNLKPCLMKVHYCRAWLMLIMLI